MVIEKKYNFSFTGASLRTRELVMVGKHLSEQPVDNIESILGNGKIAAGSRFLKEMSKRFKVLSPLQQRTLINGSFKIQNEIAFIGTCKYFSFIRDFIVEVVREKFLVYDYEITEGDYISFFRRKAEQHSEMDKLTEITQKKVKQVTFKILEQAGLIDSVKTKMIQPQLLEPETRNAILNDHIDLFKIFLLSDFDIEKLNV